MTALQLVATRELPDTDIRQLAARIADMNPWRDLGYRAADIQSLMRPQGPDRFAYSVVAQELAVGVLILRAPWWRGIYVELIGIFPEAQGRGLGHAVIDLAIAQHGSGMKNLWLLVSSTNEGARAFYGREGFVEIGVIDNLLAPEKDEILLRRLL